MSHTAKVFVVALSLVIWFAPLSSRAADDREKETLSRAREILNLYLDGEYEKFVATGTDELKEKFPPEMAAQVAAQLTAQLGKYQRERSAECSRVAGYNAVNFALRYEKSTLKLRVVLDDQQRLAGFLITGTESNVAYHAPEYVDKARFTETPVTVVTGEFELPGTLSIPTGGGKHPGLVLVHGSGPNDQDETVQANKPFRDLAWGLASRGIAVLRYEKRTHKYAAKMNPDEITLDTETIDDALSAAALLRKRPEIDSQRVYVLGHSLGGMAAPFIGAKDEKLAGIIIMAGNARSILDLLDDQLEYIAKSDGEVSDAERAQVDAVHKAAAAIRAGDTDSVEKPLLGAPAVYWERLHKRRQCETAASLHMPILVLQGGRDYQVTTKSFEQWKHALAGKSNVTFKLYQRLNHLMVAGDSPSTPSEYVEPGHVDQSVVEDIAAWIRSGGSALSTGEVR